ncbi:hypothetical protein D9M68_705490 [compost metagenome]
MHAAEAGEHRLVQAEVALRAHPQHLQAAHLRLQRGDGFGQQGLIVVAGADDDLLRPATAPGAVDNPRLDIAHQGGEMELDAMLATQMVHQRGDGLARVDLLVVQAQQRGAVMAELALVEVVQAFSAQQLDLVAMFRRAHFAEGFQQLFLGAGAGEQQGAVAADVKACSLCPARPDLTAFAGQGVHGARRLAGDQGLAEVAHRGTQGRGAALEDADAQAAAGGCIGMGQAEDAGADYGDIGVLQGHI